MLVVVCFFSRNAIAFERKEYDTHTWRFFLFCSRLERIFALYMLLVESYSNKKNQAFITNNRALFFHHLWSWVCEKKRVVGHCDFFLINRCSINS